MKHHKSIRLTIPASPERVSATRRLANELRASRHGDRRTGRLRTRGARDAAELARGRSEGGGVTMVEELQAAMACPKCGASLEMLRYVETVAVESARRVLGSSPGEVRLDHRYDLEDDGELFLVPHGKGAEFECLDVDDQGRRCGHRWPVVEAVVAQIVVGR